jgi:uridine kinase
LVVVIKNNNKTIDANGETLLELSKKVGEDFLLAKVNNELRELHRPVEHDAVIEFLDIGDSNGFRVYQRAASFMAIAAAKDILGEKTRVIVEHSINKNYYCEIPDAVITDELLTQIENKMLEMRDADLPIEKFSLPIEKAREICEQFGLYDKLDILKFRRTSYVSFYKLGWFYDYFYGMLPPSAGLIKLFKLQKQNDGFLIRFPDIKNPLQLRKLRPMEKISSVFLESAQWNRILNVDTVGSLNKIIVEGKLNTLIRVSEALHEKKIAAIADRIYSEGKRIVLIAGPSSSGKTTFAHRLCIQIKVTGLRAQIVSMDDYFKSQEFRPTFENSDEFDFESLNALDYELLANDLEKLSAGETVNVPHFNFTTGKREDKKRYITLDENDVLIVEGIHGLNEEISANLKDKFKIFISALTQLNVDDHNRIPTTDTRLLRRITRDSRYRKTDAAATIKMWPNVVSGEAKNIFPYQENADAVFNSALVYELCVLKQFVEPELFAVHNSLPEYAEAKRLVKFLDSFLGVACEEVPRNSLIREFIGGSCFR